MAKIIENIEGKRRIIKLTTDDIICIIREYQSSVKGCSSYKDIRTALENRVFFIPEDI